MEASEARAEVLRRWRWMGSEHQVVEDRWWIGGIGGDGCGDTKGFRWAHAFEQGLG